MLGLPWSPKSFLCALSFVAAITIVTSGSAVAEPPTWPQWRGPLRNGFVHPETGWPDQIGENSLKEVWRLPFGPSYSGPIVSRDQIFVTETEDSKNEVVRALDRKTGKQQWEVRWKGAMRVPFFAMANGSWIRATPAFDGKSLFVAGMRDVLVSLDAESGDERWRVDFVADFDKPLPSFGFVSSPLVTDRHIYVQAGGAVRKLDKDSGKQVWATLDDGGGMYGGAFSSPVIATLDGQKQLLVQTRQKLAGVDLDTGEVLWSESIRAFRGMNILTPTVFHDSVFTSSYGGKSLLFSIDRKKDLFEADEVWSNTTQAYMSTPVFIDNHAYLHLRNQRFTCIDLKTGERKWTSKPYGKYWSLVANGDKILALDQRGELLLIRATPEEFDLLDTRKISDSSTWAHLAVCGKEVFVRELKALAVYRWETPE
jgi:outer membrane protein assembly factor BamB